jgi:hypothetical protein
MTPSFGSPCEQGEPNPCAVPLAKRGGEPNPCAVPLAKRGGTEPLRGSPREAGGTYGGGQL